MNYYRKYLALAILGALIIGAAFYLFLNNYLDRQEILVAAREISRGEKIEEDDLCFKEYYKNSLPGEYLVSKEEVVGNIINIDREKDDYISSVMFTDELSKNILDNLAEGEILIAINVQYPEPVLEELRVGRYISIVSTEKDQDVSEIGYYNTNLNNNYFESSTNASDDKYTSGTRGCNMYENINTGASRDYLDVNSFQLSRDILLVDGQWIVRNLEVISIEEYVSSSGNMIISSSGSSISIYIKCDIKKASIIARLTQDNKYKIVIESL